MYGRKEQIMLIVGLPNTLAGHNQTVPRGIIVSS